MKDGDLVTIFALQGTSSVRETNLLFTRTPVHHSHSHLLENCFPRRFLNPDSRLHRKHHRHDFQSPRLLIHPGWLLPSNLIAMA